MIPISILTAHGWISVQPPDPKTPTGPVTLQFRPASGTPGPWETFQVDGLDILVPPAPGPPDGGDGPSEGLVATESVDYVAQVKAALEAQGVDLNGPCGAFEIVENVAYGLRYVGYGLLEKSGGNNCKSYATDVIVCPNRVDIVDILGDSGGLNTPAWGVKPNEVTSDRWRYPGTPTHPV